MKTQLHAGAHPILQNRIFHLFPAVGIGLAVLAAIAAAAAGFGSRFGWWNFRTGFEILKWAAGIPWLWLRTAERVPRIHDITTDMENPPRFVSIMPLRKDAVNPADYGGPEIATEQRAAYPDIAPLMLAVPPDRAFEMALRAAKGMGWDIVDASPGNGRIEAVATTFWFGFKDDVIVRITPASGGSRIDVRSLSRVGVSDVGTNARRVRAYLKDLAGMERS